VAIVPACEEALAPYLREDLDVVRFGPGGDVVLEGFEPPLARIRARELELTLEVPFTARHQLANLVAAVAAAQAVGVEPRGRVDVDFGPLRDERIELPSGVVVLNDCYNANPLSMRAALDEFATQAPEGRRIAVLGDMLELGPGEVDEHRALGEYAASHGVDVLIAVGPLSTYTAEAFGGEAHVVADAREAAALAEELVRPGDLVLVKASRGIGLETVAPALAEVRARG
jgi:UDP-N-acetylmuramoyl-tripeptide--D-alanyl-D-alanine ligase